MKKLVIIALLGMCINPAFAEGPFGLEMGISINAIDKNAKQAAPNVYTTANVPKPHSAFENYAMKVAPKSGLCWIKGIGKDIHTSAYGLELKSAFNDMNEKLTKVYGQGEKTDLLMTGSIWNEPKDFMMAMIKKERFLIAAWKKDNGSNLKDNLIQVALVASPINREKGYISVEYSFSNKEICDKEIADKEDDAL